MAHLLQELIDKNNQLLPDQLYVDMSNIIMDIHKTESIKEVVIHIVPSPAPSSTPSSVYNENNIDYPFILGCLLIFLIIGCFVCI